MRIYGGKYEEDRCSLRCSLFRQKKTICSVTNKENARPVPFIHEPQSRPFSVGLDTPQIADTEPY